MRGAEQSRDAIAAQRHFEALRQAVGILDDMRGSGSTAGDLQQQTRGTRDGALLVSRVYAALESLPGIGDETIAAAAAGDGGRREERGFKKHVDGVCAAHRARSTHDPRHTHSPLVVGYYEYICREFDFLAIEQRDFFAAPCLPGFQATLQLAQIVGMHGLTELEHHVLRNVDHRADGSQRQRDAGVRAATGARPSCCRCRGRCG